MNFNPTQAFERHARHGLRPQRRTEDAARHRAAFHPAGTPAARTGHRGQRRAAARHGAGHPREGQVPGPVGDEHARVAGRRRPERGGPHPLRGAVRPHQRHPDPPRLRQRLRAAAGVPRRAARALAGAGGARRAHLRHRDHRARRRLGRRGHPDPRQAARGRSLGAQRRQALHQRRRVERLLPGLGPHRRQGNFDVHGRQGPARLHRRQGPEDDGHPRHAARRTLLRQPGAGAAGAAGRARPGLQAGDGCAQRGAPGAGRRARGGQGQPRAGADDRLRHRAQAIRPEDRRLPDDSDDAGRQRH